MGDGELVVLPSKLAQPEQSHLGRLAELLGGRVADAFSSSGSFILHLALRKRLFAASVGFLSVRSPFVKHNRASSERRLPANVQA